MGLKLTFKTVQGSTFPLDLPADTLVRELCTFCDETVAVSHPRLTGGCVAGKRREEAHRGVPRRSFSCKEFSGHRQWEGEFWSLFNVFRLGFS
jgi:hypothetical protein